jgi:hypothetical protein
MQAICIQTTYGFKPLGRNSSLALLVAISGGA